MSCGRAFEIDLAAFLEGGREGELADFREHYPTCAACSAEIRAWTELHLGLGGGPESVHPTPETLLRLEDEPDTLPASTRRPIEDHVARCRSCRDELAALRGFAAPGREPSAARSRSRGWSGLLAGLRGLVLHPAFAYALLLLVLTPTIWLQLQMPLMPASRPPSRSMELERVGPRTAPEEKPSALRPRPGSTDYLRSPPPTAQLFRGGEMEAFLATPSGETDEATARALRPVPEAVPSQAAGQALPHPTPGRGRPSEAPPVTKTQPSPGPIAVGALAMKRAKEGPTAPPIAQAPLEAAEAGPHPSVVAGVPTRPTDPNTSPSEALAARGEGYTDERRILGVVPRVGDPGEEGFEQSADQSLRSTEYAVGPAMGEQAYDPVRALAQIEYRREGESYELRIPVPEAARRAARLEIRVRDADGRRELRESPLHPTRPYPESLAIRVPASWLVPGWYHVGLHTTGGAGIEQAYGYGLEVR